MKATFAFIITLIWCAGLSWVTHEVFIDLAHGSGIAIAWAVSTIMGLMNIATSALIFAFIMLSKDFR